MNEYVPCSSMVHCLVQWLTFVNKETKFVVR
jgi:hypothetical protein